LLILHKKQEELLKTGTLPNLNKYKFKYNLQQKHIIAYLKVYAYTFNLHIHSKLNQ